MTSIDFLKKSGIGFTYGISFPLTIVILDYWLKDCGISNTTIGFFSFFHLPFVLKLFFAPVIDNFEIPYLSKKLGRQRSWGVLSQIMLICSVIGMANVDPKTNLMNLMVCASFVALFDGFQNIALYPYQISDISKDNLGYAAGIVSFGHRIGTITTKLAILYLAHFFGWKIAYECASLLIFLCMIFILFIDEPVMVDNTKHVSLRNYTNVPQKNKLISQINGLFDKQNGIYIFAVLILYKASDFMIQKMSRSFCLEIGFSKLEIANIVQLFGSISVIIGGFVCGFFVKRYGIFRSMMYLSAAHMLSLLSYLALNTYGNNSYILCAVIFFEGVTGGAVSAAFLAFLYYLCKNGSQYALLWAIYEIGGMFFRFSSGFFVDISGWTNFFIVVPLFSIPGIMVLKKLDKVRKVS